MYGRAREIAYKYLASAMRVRMWLRQGGRTLNKSTWTSEDDGGYTGATAKSVFNWENRFSMTGCRLYARSTSSAVSCRSLVSSGKIPSSRSALAKATASSSHVRW